MSELNFLDLIMLQKVDKDSAVEKFGTLINTSFFETANLLGSLKVKQLVEIESSIGGASPVTLTELGKGVLLEAEEQSAKELDALDSAILSSLSRGVRELDALTTDLNIMPKDLAYHIHKLVVQRYAAYNVRSAKVSISLTEKGFNQLGQAHQAVAADAAALGMDSAVVSSSTSSQTANVQSAQAAKPAAVQAPKSSNAPSSSGPSDWTPGAVDAKTSAPAPKGQQTTLNSPKKSEPIIELPKVPVPMMRKATKLQYYFMKYWFILAVILILIVAGFALGVAKLLRLI